MNRITYETRFGTLASGYIADSQESPLTGRLRFLVCDTIRETNDPEAGLWIDSTQVIDAGHTTPQTRRHNDHLPNPNEQTHLAHDISEGAPAHCGPIGPLADQIYGLNNQETG